MNVAFNLCLKGTRWLLQLPCQTVSGEARKNSRLQGRPDTHNAIQNAQLPVKGHLCPAPVRSHTEYKNTFKI